MIAGYWDNQLLQFLAYGFPLSLHTRTKFVDNKINHASAIRDSKFVDQYFQEEVAQKAILGPFRHSPFHNFHSSPLMTRVKDKTKRRIIVDLSWGDPHSINAFASTTYEGFQYVLKYPTIDMILQRIRELGPTALLFKADIERAFRNLPIDPRDVRFLGLHWGGALHFDCSMPFGFVHGSSCCQRLTDAI